MGGIWGLQPVQGPVCYVPTNSSYANKFSFVTAGTDQGHSVWFGTRTARGWGRRRNSAASRLIVLAHTAGNRPSPCTPHSGHGESPDAEHGHYDG